MFILAVIARGRALSVADTAGRKPSKARSTVKACDR